MRELAYADPQRASAWRTSSTPWSARESARQVQAALAAGARCIVFDIPLLVESGRWRAQVDRVLVVDCSPQTQIDARRRAQRAQPAEVLAIIGAQARRAQRLAAADVVICNDGLSLERTARQRGTGGAALRAMIGRFAEEPPDSPSVILYEYPFNERIRTYLRLEHLFRRLGELVPRSHPIDHHYALATIFEVMDVAARADLKSDVMKDLEKQKQVLNSYRGNPAIAEACSTT